MTFFVECRPCRGTGELRAGHPDSAPQRGYPSGVDNPKMRGGHSGEVMADSDKSFCGKCSG